MGKQNRTTRFKDKIRIDPYQKRWIQENKICKTDAGFLDIIINFYKTNEDMHDKQL